MRIARLRGQELSMNNVSLTSRRSTLLLAASTASCGFVSFRRGETDWSAQSQLCGELFDGQGLRLAHWMQTGRAAVVKDGVHRTVYRLALEAGGFYLKHYRAPRLRNLLQNLVRPCHAVLERDASQRVAELGVPTFETVAIGRRRVGAIVSDSFLVTRAIENAVALDELLQERHDHSSQPLTADLRRMLAEKLAQLVARLHAGGLVHRDMHAGNVLVRIGIDGIRLWLIDPSPLSRRGTMGLRAIGANLALLNNSLASLLSAADRLRFFHAYWRAARSLDGGRFPAIVAAHALPPRDVVKNIDAGCARALRACHRKNDRKWVTGNRRLIIADSPTAQCRAVAAIGKEQAAKWRDDPESLFAVDVVRDWVSQTEMQKAAFVELRVGDAMTVCCATMIATDATKSPQRPLSAARRAWEGGHALLRRSLSCPRPLLFVKPTSGIAAAREYLVTESLPNAKRLSDCLERFAEPGRASLAETHLREGVMTLAARIRTMHEFGVDHGSLRAESVLVDRSMGHWDFAFWQLEDVCVRRTVSRRRAAESLAMLNQSVSRYGRITNGHRLRFLRNYLKQRFRCHWKQMWREIAAASDSLPSEQDYREIFPYSSCRPEASR